MAIILSPEADFVTVPVVHQSTAGTAEFAVTVLGSVFMREVKAMLRQQAGAATATSADAVERALTKEAQSDPDEWRRGATPDARILDSCVVDWAGVEDDDGQAVPFSRDALRQLLGIVGVVAAITTAVSHEIGELEQKNLSGWQPTPAAQPESEPESEPESKPEG